MKCSENRTENQLQKHEWMCVRQLLILIKMREIKHMVSNTLFLVQERFRGIFVINDRQMLYIAWFIGSLSMFVLNLLICSFVHILIFFFGAITFI